MKKIKETKKVYSYRIEPSIQEKARENAENCDTTLTEIITKRLKEFNDMCEKVQNDKSSNQKP